MLLVFNFNVKNTDKVINGAKPWLFNKLYRLITKSVCKFIFASFPKNMVW